jgi:hypothetical protein
MMLYQSMRIDAEKLPAVEVVHVALFESIPLSS